MQTATSTSAQVPAGPIVLERKPSGSNTDTSTARTVAMMCDYIGAAIADPIVNRAAAFARRHFAAGSSSPRALAWAAFWYVKHCVKFRVDEATMFRIGSEDEFDLLIAPAVLVRMKDPAEDCDGFTMLVAAIASILGLPVFIATVKADGGDPSRWSHVFPCAIVDGRVTPLDASHGWRPGWMVPAEHQFDFQAWGLDGKRLDIKPSAYRGLHDYVHVGPRRRYVRPVGLRGPIRYRRGVGDDETATIDFPFTDTSDSGSFLQNPPVGWLNSSAPSSTTNWTSILNNLIGGAASVAKVAETPTATYRLPDGTIISGVAPGSQATTAALGLGTSWLPIAGIGLLALFAISMVGRGK